MRSIFFFAAMASLLVFSSLVRAQYPSPPLDCTNSCDDGSCQTCPASTGHSCPSCSTAVPMRNNCCSSTTDTACGTVGCEGRSIGRNCWKETTDLVEQCVATDALITEEFEILCERVAIATNSCDCGGCCALGQGCDEGITACTSGVASTYSTSLAGICGSTSEAVCSEGAILSCEPKDEICSNGIDDDGDGTIDETTTLGGCKDEQCCNGRDDDADGLVDEDCASAQCPCRHDGKPVDLFSRQMYVGPHRVARIASDLGGSADLDFSILYDSARAKVEHTDDVSGIAGADARRQRPYVRVLAPGFRHKYSDRLVIARGTTADPTVVRWDNERAGIRFFKTSTANQFVSEPGTNHRLRRSGTTWRLLTDGGDVLTFTEGTSPGTWLHPWDATLGFHARLSEIAPGSALNRKIILLYENSPQGSLPNQLPAAACTNLATANAGEPAPPVSGCDIGRGLLVKIGVMLDASTHGQSLELAYRYVDDSGQRDQYLIKEVRAGADRINAQPVTALAQLSYLGATSVSPKRLEKVQNTTHCTVALDGCLRWRYAYGSASWAWAITDVDRVGIAEPIPPATQPTTSIIEDEDFVWDSSLPQVASHKSPGKVLSTSSTSNSTTMSWLRNGVNETYRFDFEGNPVQCSAGMCGDPTSEKRYAFSSTTAFDDVALGVDREVGEDGIWTFRRLTEGGLVDFICHVAPNLGAVPTCSLSVGDATNGSVVTMTGGTIHHLERRYYDVNGRLQVRAIYDPETTLVSGWTFPHPSDTNANVTGWFAAGTIASCGTFVPTRTFGATVHRYDVTAFTANSDGDATLNELGTADFATRPDMLVVKHNRRAQTTADTSTKAECTIMTRNARGDITRTRRFDGVTEIERVDRTYITATTDAHATGRLQDVTRWPRIDVTSLAVLSACASVPYDDEGRFVCYKLNHANGSVQVAETYSSASPVPAFAYQRTTALTFGASAYRTFERVLASDEVFQEGIGDPNVGFGLCGTFGAARLSVLRNSSDAAGDGSLETWKRLDSTCAAQETRTMTTNANGHLITTEVRNRVNALREKYVRVPDENDLTMQVTAGDGALTAVTAYSYEPWDAVASVIEADSQQADYLHGTTGFATSRLETLQRGGVAVQTRTYFRDGMLKEIKSPGEGNVALTTLSYDALRRLKSEARNAAGQTVNHTISGTTTTRAVLGTDGVTHESVVTLYDHMRRPLDQKNGSTMLRAWVYDTKGAFVGAGGTITLSDDFQRGRLAYEEDPAGATFYEYDFAGRVISVVRHNGALAAFNAANLIAIRFTYADTITNAGQLSTITYPSGMVVTYGHGPDKERAESISTSGQGSLIQTATYEPSGALEQFFRGTNNWRTVTRDILGRTTKLHDRYAGAIWSDVNYTYDLDGDVLTENDASTSHTWLLKATTGNQTRAYGYATNKDILQSWSDDGSAESVVFAAEARRNTETQAGLLFTYTPGTAIGVYNKKEVLEAKTRSGGNFTQEVDLIYDSANRVTQLDWNFDGAGTANDVIAYGQLGNATSITLGSTGTTTIKYDAQMRPTVISDPVGNVVRLDYSDGRSPLRERRTTSIGAFTDAETLFLAGEPVAQIAKNESGTTNVYYLHTDRMGVVRKVAKTDSTRVRRVISDAWGSSNATGGDLQIDLVQTSAAPVLNWRYPGQYAISDRLRLNGWRVFVPEIGQYTSPDPEPADVDFYGPQAYSYASSNPFKYIDPDGRERFNPQRPDHTSNCESNVHLNTGTTDYPKNGSGAPSNIVDRRCNYAKRNAQVCTGAETGLEEWKCGCYRWYSEEKCQMFKTCE